MSVFGVVCECNPYHTGHRKLIDEAFERGADRLVAVMSGDFVQRGEPAVLSKFDRAEDLVEQGFSLVFELPVRYSLSSSERFAAASVGLLDALGAVDTLFFGSECGDTDLLKSIAETVDDEKTKARVSELCSEGYSYPRALSAAVGEIAGKRLADEMSRPNNILAIDYLRAVRSFASGMTVETVKRDDDGYSAHAVRDMIRTGTEPEGYVTAMTAELIRKGDTVSLERWDTVSMTMLRQLTEDDVKRIPDISGGLENRFYRAAREASSLGEFCSSVNTRSFTLSRIRRAAACAVCGIFGSAPAVPPYARILAIGNGGKELLRDITGACRIPVSENLSKLSAVSEDAALIAAEEMRATDIYNIVRNIPRPAGEDLSRRLIIRN
ncbi:MAG: nucleotidyltransferase family protein [Oscillospiraceae bacterium]|nr:nucleotidyltransferase family protein [Oscillospiraceae bacterium]